MMFLSHFKQSTYFRFILYGAFVLLGVGLLFLVANYPYFKSRLVHRYTDQHVDIADQSSSGARLSPNLLIVESLDIIVPVVYVNEQSEKVFQEALKNGVVHYPGTAEPGESGNVYIFGHSSDYLWSTGNYKTIFAPLLDIKPEAEIVISDADGRTYTYQVTETKIVGPKDVSVLVQDYDKRVLTLQTSYPIGTALKRFIVVAELVNK